MRKIVVDRPAGEAAVAMIVAWTAFVIMLPLFDPGMAQPVELLLGGLGGAALIILGFAAASRVRPMTRRAGREQLRLLGWSLLLGVVMALANLAVNLGLASSDPSLHQLLAERLGGLSAWTSVLAAPVVEEIGFRLFFLSAVAILVAHVVEDRRVVFWTALTISALVFGVVHVLRPEPESLRLAWIYRLGVTLKSGVGGLLLGWIYWRWGIGYSIVCHSTINGVHRSLEGLVFEF